MLETAAHEPAIKKGAHRSVHPLPEAPGLCVVQGKKSEIPIFVWFFRLLQSAGIKTPMTNKPTNPTSYTASIYSKVPVSVEVALRKRGKKIHLYFHRMVDRKKERLWIINPKQTPWHLAASQDLKKPDALKGKINHEEICFPRINKSPKAMNTKMLEEMNRLAESVFLVLEACARDYSLKLEKVEVFFGTTLFGELIVTGAKCDQKIHEKLVAVSKADAQKWVKKDPLPQAIVLMGIGREEPIHRKDFPGVQIRYVSAKSKKMRTRIREITNTHASGVLVFLGGLKPLSSNAQSMYEVTHWPILCVSNCPPTEKAVRVTPDYEEGVFETPRERSFPTVYSEELTETLVRVLSPANPALYAMHFRR